MKQYTTPEQTAKLIEMGLEKPKSISGYYQRGPYEYDTETNTKMVVYDDTQYPIYAYSIGELLSFLPNDFRNKNKNLHTLSIYTGELGAWEINYIGFESRIRTCEYELIDAAFEMCVKLKEEGVI